MKNKRNQLMCILICIFLALGCCLTACSKREEETQPKEEKETEVQESKKTTGKEAEEDLSDSGRWLRQVLAQDSRLKDRQSR